ncbi:hypothetical protein DPV79_16150 [Burkholderia reimsis]|uniref:Bacteriophage tail tape measure C-terminal domain-containing protein n=2 Tax=Burkholderia reimsis TaxID=2234132 RepID=A0A365QVP1_9BURK|nr:hypothetical protein DPV79_16150 [Burkholderia reimsis]
MGRSAKESAAQVNENLEKIEGRLNSITKFAHTLGEVAIAGAVGDWAIEQVKAIGEYGEAVDNASQKTGIAAEEIQRLGYVGRVTGLTFDDMQHAMFQLARRMAEARGGSKEAAEALALVGVKGADLKNLSLDQVYQRIAETFKDHADGANKTALAMELMGRNGQQLIPTLNKGAEGFQELEDHAQKVGYVLDEETIAAMARLAEHMHQLDADSSAMANTLRGHVAVAFDELVKTLDDTAVAGDGAREAIKFFGEVIKGLVTIVLGAITGLSQLDDLLNGIAKAANDFKFGNFTAAGKDIADGYRQAKGEGDKFLQTYHRIWDEQQKREGANPTRHKPDVGVVHKGGSSGSTSKGLAAVAAAEAAAELALLKEKLQEEARANQDAYKSGAIGLQLYYQERQSIEERGLQGEIRTKEKERAAITSIKPQNANEALQLKAKQITVDGQLAVLEQRLADSRVRNAREYALALRDQNDQLARIAAASTVAVGGQAIAQQKALNDLRVALGQETAQQSIAVETDLENQRFALQRAEFDKEIELAHNKPVELAKINADILAAEAEHQTKMVELSAKGIQDQMKYQVEGTQVVESSFEGLFEKIATGQETARKAVMDFFTAIQQGIAKVMAKGLTENLFGGGTGGGGVLSDLMTRLFGNQGTNTTPSAGTTTGSSAASSGIGSVFKGLFGGSGSATLAGINSSQMTVAAMQAASATIPTATVATMTVANMISAGGGGSGGGGGFGDMLGGLFGGSTNSYGFSLAGTGVPDAMSAATSGAGMALPAGLGGIGAGIPMYDKGTNYIPQTQLAIVHRGEAVVPAAYNRPQVGSVVVTNHFSLGQATDLRTQSQIASMAAGALNRAARRNG